MKLIKKNTGLLRSARSWGVLGLVLVLAVALGADKGTLSVMAQGTAPMAQVPAPKCPKPPVVYLGGVADNFVLPPEAVTLSPALAAFLIANPTTSPTPRQFDEGGANSHFGHSFRLESCKVCAVQFETLMRAQGGGGNSGYGNDGIAIYGQTINGAGLIWTAPTGPLGSGAPGTFFLNAFLPAPNITLLNSHIFTNAPGAWLNVYAQDDHAFDYMRVTVWYY